MEIISRHKIHFQNLPWFFPCLKVKLERSNSPCLIPRLLLIFGSQLPYFRVLFRDIGNLPLFCKDTRESEWLSLFIHLGSSPCYALLGEIFSGYNLESKGYSLHWEPPPSSLVNAQLEEERQRSDSFQSYIYTIKKQNCTSMKRKLGLGKHICATMRVQMSKVGTLCCSCLPDSFFPFIWGQHHILLWGVLWMKQCPPEFIWWSPVPQSISIWL